MSTASQLAATPPEWEQRPQWEEDEELLSLKGRRRRRKDEEMDITPMIDITFLLLIFFVVAAKLDPQQAVDLPRAEHGLAVAADDAAVVIVREGTAGRAEVLRADGRPFAAEPEQQGTELVDYLTQELNAGKAKIVLQVSGEARHGEVSRIRRVIGDTFDDLEVVYIAVMEQT